MTHRYAHEHIQVWNRGTRAERIVYTGQDVIHESRDKALAGAADLAAQIGEPVEVYPAPGEDW